MLLPLLIVPFQPIFQETAGPRWIDRAAQCKAESGFNPRAVSHAGARGIAQFMPATWRLWAPAGHDPFDPVQGIRSQHRYMLWIEGRFSGDWHKALAGYNCGPGNVTRAMQRAQSLGATDQWAWLRVGLPLVTGKHAAETQAYVPRILKFKADIQRKVQP